MKNINGMLILLLLINTSLAFGAEPSAPSADGSYKPSSSEGGKAMSDFSKKDKKKNDPLETEVDSSKLNAQFTRDPQLSEESYNQAERQKLIDKINDRLLERNLDSTIRREECKKLKTINEVVECYKKNK